MIALVLAVIFTLAINISVTRKYTSAARTVKVVPQATQFIPAWEMITPEMVRTTDVPSQIAQELVTGGVSSVVGKSVKVSIMQDQFFMSDDLDTSGRDPGTVEVYVMVTVPSGAWSLPGDYVDVWLKGQQNNPAVLIFSKAKVLHTVDANAKQTESEKTAAESLVNSSVVAVGIEVPADQAVSEDCRPCFANQIYLVRSAL